MSVSVSLSVPVSVAVSLSVSVSVSVSVSWCTARLWRRDAGDGASATSERQIHGVRNVMMEMMKMESERLQTQ